MYQLFFCTVAYCYLQLPFWIELKYCWRTWVDHCWTDAILFTFPQTETSAEPSLQAKQLKLKRARLADDLNEKIAQRPGPMELVEKNILPVESSLKEAIIGKVRGGSLWRAFPTCGCDYLSFHLNVNPMQKPESAIPWLVSFSWPRITGFQPKDFWEPISLRPRWETLNYRECSHSRKI